MSVENPNNHKEKIAMEVVSKALRHDYDKDNTYGWKIPEEFVPVWTDTRNGEEQWFIAAVGYDGEYLIADDLTDEWKFVNIHDIYENKENWKNLYFPDHARARRLDVEDGEVLGILDAGEDFDDTEETIEAVRDENRNLRRQLGIQE